jgi:retron-type reverse transcriptase
MGRVRRRVGDKRVLLLVKAFLKSGLLTVDGAEVGTITGTPQGGILSPLLANIALRRRVRRALAGERHRSATPSGAQTG